MMPRYGNLLMILGGGLLFLVFWAASVGFVYWDVYRRDLPWRRQIGWIAAVALLPLVGFLAYLLARFVLPLFGARKAGQKALNKRETLPLHIPQPQVYLPTMPVEPENGPGSGKAATQYVLALVEGAGAGQAFSLRSLPAEIGRGPGVAIRLDADRSVSRRHAEIYERMGSLFIRDLDSTHGTQVNGVWIGDQRLEPGDEVQIGGSLLVFRVQEGLK